MARNKTLFGVVLVSTGFPQECSKRAVRKHMTKVLSDRRVAEGFGPSWSVKLSTSVLPGFLDAMTEGYSRIWTEAGEPATADQQRLVQGMNGCFGAEELDVMVRGAYRVGSPSIEDAMGDLRQLGCERLVVLPLFPYASFTATQAIDDAVNAAESKTKWKAEEVTVIQGYAQTPTFDRAIAASIRHAGFDPASNDKLLFSNQAIPMHDVWLDDPYPSQVEASCKRVAAALGLGAGRAFLGYQGALSDDRPWIEPPTEKVLQALAARPGRLFVVCPSFALDCVDTLDLTARVLADTYARACADQGGEGAPGQLIYVPCLGKSRAHVRVLHDVLLPYLLKEA